MIRATETNFRPKKINSREEAVQTLITYIRQMPISDSAVSPTNRFRYNDEWYFRTSWISPVYLEKMKNLGLVEKAGSYAKIMGEPGQRGAAMFYRIINNEINDLISKTLT